MPLVNFANLDFDQIKVSIKDYLRTNSNFTDYDFEGSNLASIIDVLAYNTYITSYNANMVANEVFIDSATLRENVVALARNVGYVPKSRTAARMSISLNIDTSLLDQTPENITLKAGPVATSSTFQGDAFVFNALDDVTVQLDGAFASFENIELYEGTVVKHNFTVDAYNPNQRFILPNPGIDTSTLRVTVKPNKFSDIVRKYRQATSIFGITSEDPVFWVQETEGERYELIFGDGVFGKALQAGNYIEISCVVSNGESANAVNDVRPIGQFVSTRDNNLITGGIGLIKVETPSFGGKDIESVSSIKKYATQIYASQNRAVTASDYEAIIPRLYPESESVSVFGGEELSPPQFGKVYVSIKPVNGAYLSNLIKDNIKRELKQYSVAGIIPEIIDLKYLYIESDIKTYYNTNLAASSEALTTQVTHNVERYANSVELNKFGARFKYSKFLKLIDETNSSITSNITTIVIRRDMRAALNTFAEYEICFGNRFYVKNHGHSPEHGVGYNIKSSGFSVSGIPGTVYLADTPNMGLETGTVNLFRLESPTEATIVRRNVGTIDYIKGEIKLNPINITSTVMNEGFPLIQISAIPYSNDVIGLQDLYLQLDTSNTKIESISDRISSGNDISGSNYIVSSSYANGSLVRGPVITRQRANTTSSTPTATISTSTSTTTSTMPTSSSTSSSY